MSFDVSTVEVADQSKIVINHPNTNEPFMIDVEIDDGEGGKKTVKQAMTITVHGPGSKPFKAAQALSKQKYMTTFHRGKSRETEDQEAARTARFLAGCTVQLDNFNYKGMDPKDAEGFRQMYLDPKMGWITEQVNAEMGDWANFTQAAPSS